MTRGHPTSKGEGMTTAKELADLVTTAFHDSTLPLPEKIEAMIISTDNTLRPLTATKFPGALGTLIEDMTTPLAQLRHALDLYNLAVATRPLWAEIE
jgi:hypothetical protein